MDTFYWLIGRDADPIAWWQMSARAVIIFAWAVALYRFMPRRAFGSNAALDIVVVVIMGSALSRALSGSAPILPTIAATSALALLYALFNWLAMRFDPVSRLLKGRRIRLIRDGEIDDHALREAQLGRGDLMENLRASGVEDVAQVEDAFLERNGKVTVIKRG